MRATHPLAEDLDLVLARTEGLWPELRGQKIFITGGTGFFGRWLLESFIWVNARLALGASAVVLTRDPGAFTKRAPALAHNPDITLHTGDVIDYQFPAGSFSHFIHGAAEVNAKMSKTNPKLVRETVVSGTKRTTDFAAQAGCRKFLFISSGAVYGKQPPEVSHIPEDFSMTAVEGDSPSPYGEGKRAGEALTIQAAQTHGFEAKIARCFAFLGPYLPQDGSYAIGNFIRDARAGGPIRVLGDGTPIRSYLYAADLVVWLWHILMRGQNGRPYNVGSDQALSIAETARAVAACHTPTLPVLIEHQESPALGANRYVPSTDRAKLELQLTPWTSLRRAILKTSAHFE